MKQGRPIINTFLYGTDVVLQETFLAEGAFAAVLFYSFCNRRHLGQVIMLGDNMMAPESDMSAWDRNTVHMYDISVQTSVPLVFVNVYTCSGEVDVQI